MKNSREVWLDVYLSTWGVPIRERVNLVILAFREGSRPRYDYAEKIFSQYLEIVEYHLVSEYVYVCVCVCSGRKESCAMLRFVCFIYHFHSIYYAPGTATIAWQYLIVQQYAQDVVGSSAGRGRISFDIHLHHLCCGPVWGWGTGYARWFVCHA